ncbi:MAG: hypothetical protein RL043_1199, partial [Pseudomonadota bacterium]
MAASLRRPSRFASPVAPRPANRFFFVQKSPLKARLNRCGLFLEYDFQGLAAPFD